MGSYFSMEVNYKPIVSKNDEFAYEEIKDKPETDATKIYINNVVTETVEDKEKMLQDLLKLF